jgi:hypothetical protein
MPNTSSHGRGAEEERGDDEHALAADLVGQRSEDEGAHHQAEEPGAEQRRQLRRRHAPCCSECRGNEADRGRVEAVYGHHQDGRRDR